MESNALDDFLFESSGCDIDWQCMLQSFESDAVATGVGTGNELAGVDISVAEPSTSKKRALDETCSGPKSKSCREKLRRDRLNDRFQELSSVLEPGRPPKADKAGILSDAARLLIQLKAEAQELKETNEKLQETIIDLKAEKNELREEKIKLKVDKDRLEKEVKTMSAPPAGFFPHSFAFHPAAAPTTFGPCLQAPGNKGAPNPAFPGMAMWQWLPLKAVDISQDHQLWPPNA